jgi:hypothetical protein
MNRSSALRLTLMLASMLTLIDCGWGCAAKKSAPPASRETLAAVRQHMAAADPNALVGLVIAVEPGGQPFAAVSDMPAKEFREGEPITFIDSNRKYLTNGFVRRITEDTLHVEWVKPGSDGRAPRAGDLAIRFKS